ncbi:MULTISPECIES: methionine--tRNA ligase [unclassified Treponema]|uniref:methionine--tRNA ligase n=1 Tax=unclassified Treponema TaxID=2638727 RepID=UPI00053011C6|nr:MULTISPECIES: methionine--tRNA ligase [unclassified Treponema]AIW90144.1 methionyl-tRNA synthetase [Treponema sp. OMZ 838]UTC49870.1 methionine--tRNA ligase [Treponema sp. OMZ 855]
MKRKLITSALPYVNNIPHLGNLIQVLSADVFARFCRLRGYTSLYVCGTDEYGTATETKALEEGKTPRELCDYYHAIHRDIYHWFNIAFDYFGRTSTPQQTEIVQGIFKDIEKNGFIKEHSMEQLHCAHCNRFLADRYVRGTCPHCGYEDARGDQCEACGKLLEPTELKAPRCSTCGAAPEPRSTKHLYIDLPGIVPQYEPWMQKASVEGQWSNNAVQMTKGWLRDGLQERAITRDLKWGIPVPKAGFEDKVFYVWFDAPIGYISITKCFTDLTGADWKNWWLEQNDIELFQFIGKDNIPFHTVIFPSSLIASGKDWVKLHHISSSEYLNYESGKFSKSKGIGVFGSDAKDSGIPADMWRFYIFYNRPEKNDALFTWKDFQERVNSELVGNLCNLINRTLTFVSRYYDGVIPQRDGMAFAREDVRAVTEGLRAAAKYSIEKITALLEEAELRDAFHELFTLSSVANKAFQDGEPWKNREADPEKAEALLFELCYLIKDLLILMHPYMPEYADAVASFLGIKIWSGNVFDWEHPVQPRPENTLAWKNLLERSGLERVQKPAIIFKTLENDAIAAYRERYAGSQKERAAQAGKQAAGKQAGGEQGGKKQQNAGSKNEKQKAKPEWADISPEQLFTDYISLKTAKILSVEKHPDADKLFVETIDDGSEGGRVILSGLAPYFAPEELVGADIILAENLKPRKMRGIESKGMLLASHYTDADGTERVELVGMPGAAAGTPVMLGDAEAATSPVQKPQAIDAEMFFAVPFTVEDFRVCAAGKQLLVNGKPLVMKHVKTGTVQ